jgi:hypothetical protein
MGSRRHNANVMDNSRNAPWILSAYEEANGQAQGTARNLTPTQMLSVIGLPVPMISFEFTSIAPLYLTTWHTDLEYDGKVFRASADLLKGGRIDSNTELYADGSTYKLSAIRPEIIEILESDDARGTRVVVQAAIMTPSGTIELVLDADVGYISKSTLDVNYESGQLEATFKTDSVYKVYEGTPSNMLLSTAQHFYYPGDTSFDNITAEMIEKNKKAEDV